MINDDDYQEERKIIKKITNDTNEDESINYDKIIFEFLKPYILDGIDAIVDDGYLLYLSDAKKEMAEYLNTELFDKSKLKLYVSNYFDDKNEMNSVIKEMKKALYDKYLNHAPIPKRSLQEYIQYADSKKTDEEFEKSYYEYKNAIDDLLFYCTTIVDNLKSCEQTKKIERQTAQLKLFMNKISRLKNIDFFKSLTYKSSFPVENLFYPEVFASEDIIDTIDGVVQQPIILSKDNYTLEELYAAIPNDVISYDLLENEEIDPNDASHSIDFFQSFYDLALQFSNIKEKKDIEKIIHQFLINKINEFQDAFSEYCYEDEDEDDRSFYYEDIAVLSKK